MGHIKFQKTVINMKKITLILAILVLALMAAMSGCKPAVKVGASMPTGIAPQTSASLTQTTKPGEPILTKSPAVSTSVTSQPTETTAQTAYIPINPPIIDGVVTIKLADAAFTPSIVWIPAGTTVEWWTEDHLSVHAVDSEDGIKWGHIVYWQPLRITFSTPGTYRYYDDAETIVKGTIVVF
jgi:plastocyanin